jgi:hypothetical protein
MTNKKRVVTSGKVKVPKYGVINIVSNELIDIFGWHKEAKQSASFYPEILKAVRLSGTVSYTVAK